MFKKGLSCCLLIITVSYHLLAQEPELILPIGHIEGQVNCLKFSPDNKYLISTGDDPEIKVWEVETGKLLTNLIGHKRGVYSAKFSIKGDKILSASFDGTAKLWSFKSGKVLFSFINEGPVYYAEFSKDEKKIMTISYPSENYGKGVIMVWDATTGKKLQRIEENMSLLYSAEISKDGKFIITSSSIGKPSIWDIETGRPVYQFETEGEKIGHVGISGDGVSFVACGLDSVAYVFDIKSKKTLFTLKHAGAVFYSSFSPDGRYIITGSNDGFTRLWNSTNGKLIHSFNQEGGYVYNCMFSGDGNYVLTHSNRKVRCWDFKTRMLVNEFEKTNNAGYGYSNINIADISANSRFLTSAIYSFRGEINICYINKKKVYKKLSGNVYASEAVFVHDNSLYALLLNTKYYSIWDIQKVKMLYAGNRNEIIIADTINYSLLNKEFNGRYTLRISGDESIVGIKDKYFFFLNKQLNKVVRILPVDSSDYLILDDKGRYDGTADARKLLYFTCGTEVIDLDQVKDQLWVPNLAERLLKGDSINAKTLNDLNICGLTPEVEDKSTGDGNYRFEIRPRRGGFGETVLYVNGIEAKRYKPSALKRAGTDYLLTVTQKELSNYFMAGRENTVSVKSYTADNAITSRGVDIRSVDSSDKSNATASLYAVMVGVSDYKGEKLDLKYAAKDAIDIANALEISSKKLLNFDGKEHVFIYNLTTSYKSYGLPEKNTIKKVLEDIAGRATANDILLIFFAGHGVMAGEKKKFYFLTADASDATEAFAVPEVGISTTELTEWIKPQSIKAQKRILIFDACNSGQAIMDFVKVGNDKQGYIAARGDDQSQQIKAIDKLNEQSGFFILAASASNQSAYEMSRYSQGLLTYSLLKAIKQQPDILEQGKFLDVSRWFNAAEKTVSEITKENGARQQPQVVSNTNFNLGIVDEEVMSKIILAQEKPLFTNSNLQNADENIAMDDLELNKWLDLRMIDISSRGTESPIIFTAGIKSQEAWALGGRYEVNGNNVIARINIRQGREIKYRFDITGTLDKLEELIQTITEKVFQKLQNKP